MAGLPIPALDDTIVVVFVFAPTEPATTFTLNVQLPPGGRLAFA